MMRSAAMVRWSAEIDGFETVLDALSALRLRDDAARLRELVRLRPELASRVAKVREAGLAALAGRDPASVEDYRTRVSAMQRHILLLQADWPAPEVAGRQSEYARAATAVAEANRAFVAWARDALQRAN